MRFSASHIRHLLKAGKIRGYSEPVRVDESIISGTVPGKKTLHGSKALTELTLTLHHWSAERKLQLEKEHRFDEERKWRFDFAWPALKIAVEFEGGIYQHNSGHKTAKHYTKDTDKYNRAAVLGWRVIRITAKNHRTVLKHLNELYAANNNQGGISS